MSAIATTVNSNTVSPFRWIRDEFKYRLHDLSDRVKSLGRFTLEKLKSFKPVSRDFQKKMASPDGLATEYRYQNGLRIFHIHDKKAKRTTVEMVIQLPQTKEKVAGTNHFLEHMLAESPLGPLKKDMETWSAENGVKFDAGTSQDKMFFEFSCEPDKLKPVLEFLATLYQDKPIDYDSKILEGEREVIQKERQGSENTPSWAIGFKIMEFFKGKAHYTTKNVLGSQNDINSIQVEHLEDARRHFNIGDSTLTINSASKLPDSFISQCFKNIKAKPAKNERTPIDYSELSKETKQVFKHHDLSDSLDMYFYPNSEKLLKSGLSKLDKLRLTVVLIYSLLDGNDSRLQKLFQEKHINAGDTAISFDHEGRGSLNISISETDKKYFSQILSLISKELEKVAKEGLSLEELNLIRKMAENGLEWQKENPLSDHRSAIGLSLSTEHDNWLDYTKNHELRDFWEKITKDQESVNAFNKELKEFLDIYFISGKSKTVETHHDGNSNVANFSSGALNPAEMKTESHYKRPVPESFNKPGFVRLPSKIASMSKLDEKTYLVKDREANIARVYVINRNGMFKIDDPILKSNDRDLIMQESYRKAALGGIALRIFHQTLGAEDHLRPEKLDIAAKNLACSFAIDTEPKILDFSISGVKSGAKAMLELVKQVFSNPALLSTDAKSKTSSERVFRQTIESRLKFLEELKLDRGSMVSREFYNTLLEGDPERLKLDPDSEIKILKSITLDDVRKFFKENFIFDNNLKILLNSSALEAGLDSGLITNTLDSLNQNDTNKLTAKEFPEAKLLAAPPVKKLEMTSNLDKTTALIMIGNLSDDLRKLSVRDRYLLADSIDVLRGGLTGNLGARLREKGIYHWRLNFSLPSENLGKIHTPQSVFAVQCNCDPSQVDDIRQLIRSTLQEYLDEGPKLEELMRLRHRENSKIADGLQITGNRHAFFSRAFKRNRSPNAGLKLVNAPSCDTERAKELLRMVIKPDNFTEVVDIPKSAQRLAKVSVKPRTNSGAALAELPAAA